ncbi:PH domain-containing protein DDB_G0275795-like [Triticum urartu]|uniref:PH domain-containing protein DDB_G0275795-like n=1 Tax=Triticum urartu TaxID=4572 RepID=UPI002043C4BF|nr:PH domain-containing protein DDB_G0275795-like [Triticum urartu]
MDEDEEIEGVPAFFHRHPLLLCFLLFLAFTYAFVYPVFAFILAAAPVLVLTALLLGLVLLHSVPQDHDPHVYNKISHRPPQVQPSTTGAITTHHHRPSHESSDSSSSVDENDHHPPTMSNATSHASFPDTAANSESESTDSDHEEKQHNHQRSEKKDAVRAVAWTADDAKSIENIGSLELEMNATVEKLMSRRRARGHQRPLHHHQQQQHVMELDDPSKLSIATRKRNPFDLDGPYDEDDNFPDSAPSMLGLRPSRNPFFDDMDDDLQHQAPPEPSSIPGAPAAQKNAMLFRRHESFTVGAPYVSDFRPSRFRPYFVTEKMQGQPVTVPEASRESSSSSTSSSSAGATAYAYAYAYASANKEEEAAAEQEEALAAAEAEAEAATMLEEVKPTVEYSSRSHEVAAVDVELISDSSDDDMTLPGGGHAHKGQHVQAQQQQEEEEEVAEQEQQMKMEQEQEQRMKQQLAEQEQRMKQAAEQEQQMKMQMQQQQQQQLALSDDDEGDSFEVESITKQVAAAAAGKTKQLETDPAYDYSPSKTEKAAFAQLPPPAPPNKLQTMRRVFSEEDADEPWAAPSGLEETGREQDMLSAPAAGAAPPLSAAAKKAIGKSTKYKPPSKKAVLGFFRK